MTQAQADNMIAMQYAANQYLSDTLQAAQLTAGHVQMFRDVSVFLCVSVIIGLTVIFGLLARKTPS